jgi:general L-amino acid transport system substrate-binding protein
MLIRTLSVAAAAWLSVAPAMADSPTLSSVRGAGTLKCGVVGSLEDWNKTDLHGPLAPLSLEICKAVSVAAMGPQAKVAAKTYATELEAEEGLSKSEVDLLVGVTPDATAMWHWHIAFGAPVFYDAQMVMVRNDSHAATFKDVGGMSICVVEGTDNESILQAQLHIRKLAATTDAFQEEGEMEDAVATRHCDGVSAYVSHLAQFRLAYAKQVGHDKILPDILRLSPVTVAYRPGDQQWSMIVDWTVYSLIQAEASGVTQANVAEQRGSEDPVVQRLLGIDWATSRALGLEAHDWAAKVISVVGNYGEIYDRTLGAKSPLNMPRGLNRLWLDGGLMYPLPVQ